MFARRARGAIIKISLPLDRLVLKVWHCWHNSARAQLRLCTTSAGVGGWGLWISPFKQMCLANGALRKGSAFDTQPSSGTEVGGGPRTRLARPIVSIAISSQKRNLVLYNSDEATLESQRVWTGRPAGFSNGERTEKDVSP